MMQKNNIACRALVTALALIMMGSAFFAGMGDTAYAKAIGQKNEQACDHCENVKNGEAPSGYSSIETASANSVYRGGNSKSQWQSGWYDGVALDDDPNDFVKPLPYGNVFIDIDKLNWDDPEGFIIDIKDKEHFKWVSSGGTLVDAEGNTSTDDPMGLGKGIQETNGICYVGELNSFHTSIMKPASDEGTPNPFTAKEGSYLYRITYKNAATLPDGTHGDLVITMKEVVIETSYAVSESNPHIIKDDQGGELYRYEKALVQIQAPNELNVTPSKKDNDGNRINAETTVAKTSEEVEAQVEAAREAGADFGPKNATGYRDIVFEDKLIRHATGAELIFDIEVKDSDGNEVEGTIAYAAHDLDLTTLQNIWGRSVAADSPDRNKFNEGMTIVSGALSYALTPTYGNKEDVKYVDVASFQGDGWVEKGPFEEQPDSPLMVSGGSDKTANGVRFSSRGIVNPRDQNGEFKDALVSKGSNGYINLATGGTTSADGNNLIRYRDLNENREPTSLVKKLMLGKACDDQGNPVAFDTMTLENIYNYLGDASWKTGRNDELTSFDTGFAVLLDAKKTSIKWSGSQSHAQNLGTQLFDTTVFTYIEQTHGTGGGIYLENYVLPDCETTRTEGVVTMAKGDEATITIVPEDGYRVKEIRIGGKELSDPTTYTMEDLGFEHGVPKTVEMDGYTFEMNRDGSVDVTLYDIQDPKHVHADFTNDYYFYKVWRKSADSDVEIPDSLSLAATPFVYEMKSVVLDGVTYNISEQGTKYTSEDGSEVHELSPNYTITIKKGDKTTTWKLIGDTLVSGKEGSPDYEVAKITTEIKGGTAENFTISNSGSDVEDGFVTVEKKNGDVIWKVRYPAEGRTATEGEWPALAIETYDGEEHNYNHVERYYWFVSEEVPEDWTLHGYDNSKALSPGVVTAPDSKKSEASGADNTMWREQSEVYHKQTEKLIKSQEAKDHAFMSPLSTAITGSDMKTKYTGWGGKITNVVPSPDLPDRDPDDPTEPGEDDAVAAGAVTGDNNSIVFWMTMLIAAFTCISVLVISRRRHNQ